ncbi:hypothetical protein JCM31447_23300 [Fluviispira sanaruensis]|uniref:Uncharacterized protein n=1 Tax=Fluviispira sanaruensis TaxID=2493639 RepID=A0A4V0P2N8_FLUSA|nr:hypothetical protein JCM31447_23300 [Fluviispira sanaruensis]
MLKVIRISKKKRIAYNIVLLEMKIFWKFSLFFLSDDGNKFAWFDIKNNVGKKTSVQ